MANATRQWIAFEYECTRQREHTSLERAFHLYVCVCVCIKLIKHLKSNLFPFYSFLHLFDTRTFPPCGCAMKIQRSNSKSQEQTFFSTTHTPNDVTPSCVIVGYKHIFIIHWKDRWEIYKHFNDNYKHKIKMK